ncbi:hypothetical protein JOD67_001480 [Tenggerimyces flavus]|nr:hypothetical protein [Tenggerimyces flavus]
MPTNRPHGAGRRGPVAREPVLSPTGYRISERTKFELVAAMSYTGATTLQAVIDIAVAEFLERMGTTPGYKATLRTSAAERLRRGLPVPQSND